MGTFLSRIAGALALGAMLFAASCASMETVQTAELEDAESRSFAADYRKVVDSAVSSLRGMGMIVQSVTEESGRTVILFTRPIAMWSSGAVGRLIVDHNATTPTTAYINYERRGPSYASGQGRWARAIFARMEKDLGLVAAK